MQILFQTNLHLKLSFFFKKKKIMDSGYATQEDAVNTKSCYHYRFSLTQRGNTYLVGYASDRDEVSPVQVMSPVQTLPDQS